MNSERGFIFCMLLIGIELHYSLTFSLQHLLETHPEVPPIPHHHQVDILLCDYYHYIH